MRSRPRVTWPRKAATHVMVVKNRQTTITLMLLKSKKIRKKIKCRSCRYSSNCISGISKPRPYFWHEIRSSTHREQFGESRRPSEHRHCLSFFK